MNITKLSLILFFVFSLKIQGQRQGKVGINIDTPTEILDLNGNLRIRSIPNNGTNSIYTTGSDTSSLNPDQKFISVFSLVGGLNYNILGKTSRADLVPNRNIGFTTDDNSKAMFVIKRYKIGDYPSKDGFDTEMSTTKWIAILSNVGFSFTFIDEVNNVFNESHLHSWSLTDDMGTTWKIVGDINGVREKSDSVDVLFIKRSNVASESRGNAFPF